MVGGGRQERERAAAESAQRDRENQVFTQANTPDPLEEAYKKSQLDFLNWDKSAGKDVRAAPGLDNYIQIGQSAMDRANQERQGTGALALGDAGASGYLANLRSLRQNEQGQAFGTGLENALAGRRAEATGSVIPLTNLRDSRNMNLLNHSGSMLGTYINRPRATPWWQTVLGQIGGVTQGVGAAYAGR